MKALYEIFEVESPSIVTHFCGAAVRTGDPRPEDRRLQEIQPDQVCPPLAMSRVRVAIDMRKFQGNLKHKVSKLHYGGWVSCSCLTGSKNKD